MGRKAKATENGLVELIVDKWDGGKNTIVYVTQEVNKILEEKGLPHVEPEHLIDESEMEEIIAQEGGKVIDKVEENND